MSPRLLCSIAIVLFFTGPFAPRYCRAEDDFERPPIEYSKSTPNDRITQLQKQLNSGELKLDYDKKFGYLPAFLKAVEVPVSSQMFVFSKTSFQRSRIAPRTPRAVYFSDDMYVGYCHAGEVLEVAAIDPQLGCTFYSVDQRKAEKPKILRQTENCLICHSSTRSEGVPGLVVRSVFTGKSGEPILSAGGYSVDYTTPLEHRWGGWYVTGTHGKQHHLGNLLVKKDEVEEPVTNETGENVTSLKDRFSVDSYLSPHSDIVALMVLEHQVLVHNRITRANFEARSAMHYQREINKALGEPGSNRLDSVSHRIESAGDKLVEALLFVDEAKFVDEIQGSSSFVEEFAKRGPRDAKGRSLRELDLKTRLFKYPCSFLIDTPAFDALPDEIRTYVWQRLWNVLSGKIQDDKFAHLSADDRRAIVEIVQETKPNVPDYWKSSALASAASP